MTNFPHLSFLIHLSEYFQNINLIVYNEKYVAIQTENNRSTIISQHIDYFLSIRKSRTHGKSMWTFHPPRPQQITSNPSHMHNGNY